MKLANFAQGRLGIIDGEELIDATEACGIEPGTREGPVSAAIGAGTVPLGVDDPSLADAPRWPLADVVLESPMPRPQKIVAAPVNYLAHKDEMCEEQTVADYGVFLKASTSVIGPGDTIQLPYTDKRTDQEGELALVIGKGGRNIPAEDALGHVFGYTCLLDITVRSTEDRSTRKSFDTFTPIGPWIVTADEVGDPGQLMLRCSVNQELRQESSTSLLVFGVADLIAYASSVMTLEPGDVLSTGTPAGVGPISDGDTITVDIEKIGQLFVNVSAAGAEPYYSRHRALSAAHQAG